MAVRYRIVVSPRAMADLDRLEAFIAVESLRRARKAIARVVRGVSKLSELPHLGKPIADGYRELILPYGKSAYIVRYRIRDEQILITRIWHGREDRSG